MLAIPLLLLGCLLIAFSMAISLNRAGYIYFVVGGSIVLWLMAIVALSALILKGLSLQW